MRLSGVIAERMVGFCEAAKRHCLSVSAGVVSLLAISVGLSSLGWVKSSVGWVISLCLSYAISCICWSSRMWPSSSVVLDKLVGKFLGDST